MRVFIFIRLTCLLTIILNGAHSQAQDSLVTMSGKYMDVSITNHSGANIFFTIEKKNNQARQLSIHKGDVFSFTKEGQTETLLYAQDVDFGYELSVDDMRHFIYGQHDARVGYNPTPSMVAGFAVGLGSALYLESGLLPLSIPVFYSLGMQIPVLKIKAKTISDPSYKSNPNYKLGYEKTARSKKMVKSLIGSAAGVILGIGIYEVTQ